MKTGSKHFAVKVHDIEDISIFCRLILTDWQRAKGWYFGREDAEDAHSFLVETALFDLAPKYDKNYLPNGWEQRGSKSPGFRHYARKYLALRLTNWARKNFGDERYLTTRPVKLSLDCAVDDSGNTLGDGIPGDDTWERVDARAEIQERYRALSSELQWVWRNVAVPIAEGAQAKEVALLHNKSTKWVTERMTALRTALEESA